jgi:hypothetical protein
MVNLISSELFTITGPESVRLFHLKTIPITKRIMVVSKQQLSH